MAALSAATLSPTAMAQTSAKPLDLSKIAAAADAAARAQIEGGVTPGMTVAVGQGGRVVFVRGYGKADLDGDAAAGAGTVYKIGSVTKQFTAAAVLRLVEAGKLSLDDPVTKHLPDYPAHGRRVTVRHLLNHTSGVKSFGMDDKDEAGARLFARDLTYRDMVRWFGAQPLEFEPGSKFRYNNTAYYLLGEIIGRVAGVPYAEYVERELLRPLGLRRTVVPPTGSGAVPGLARGYEPGDGGKFSPAAHVGIGGVGAAGALCSTAGDLIRWTHLLHAGRAVSPRSLRQMTAPTVLSGGGAGEGGEGGEGGDAYGFGLFLGEMDGHRRVYHGGRGLGFLTQVTHYPDEGVTVVVLMNSGGDRRRRDQVERAVARAALGTAEVRDLPLTAGDVARYEGDYVITAGARSFDLRVSGEGGRLLARVGDGAATRLRYQGGHRFVQDEKGEVRLAFTMEDGRAQGVAVDLRGQTLRGRRKP